MKIPYGLTLNSAPAAEPVSTVEAKTQLRISHANDDTEIARMVKAAREYCEEFCERAFINQTWVLKMDKFPRSSREPIRVPKAPLSSVSSITYLDSAGTSQTWSASNYTVDTDSEPGRIYPAFSEVYPTTRDIPAAVTITFIAGYGATSASVPEKVRQAIMMLVEHWYNNRSAVLVGTASKEIEFSVLALLSTEAIREIY